MLRVFQRHRGARLVQHARNCEHAQPATLHVALTAASTPWCSTLWCFNPMVLNPMVPSLLLQPYGALCPYCCFNPVVHYALTAASTLCCIMPSLLLQPYAALCPHCCFNPMDAPRRGLTPGTAQ